MLFLIVFVQGPIDRGWIKINDNDTWVQWISAFKGTTELQCKWDKKPYGWESEVLDDFFAFILCQHWHDCKILSATFCSLFHLFWILWWENYCIYEHQMIRMLQQYILSIDKLFHWAKSNHNFWSLVFTTINQQHFMCWYPFTLSWTIVA